MSKEEALLLRADLLQVVKGLELQRAGVLSIISRIEKEYHIEKGDKDGRSKTVAQYNQGKSRTYTKPTNSDVLQSRGE
jgi:hypothetical protein